jgi:hypothetical protein
VRAAQVSPATSCPIRSKASPRDMPYRHLPLLFQELLLSGVGWQLAAGADNLADGVRGLVEVDGTAGVELVTAEGRSALWRGCAGSAGRSGERRQVGLTAEHQLRAGRSAALVRGLVRGRSGVGQGWATSVNLT